MTLPKYIIGQPTTVLVAHHDGTKDSKGNPINLRSQITFQHTIGGGPSLTGSVGTDALTASTGELTVADNDFSTGKITIILGQYELRLGENFTSGGSVSATAVAIAAAISNLPGFSATPTLGVVDIVGPSGPFGENVVFKVLHEGSIENITLSPSNGKLLAGTPVLGPMTII